MPDTFTTNLNLDLPEVGADNDTWGGTLNSDLTAIDALFASSGGGTIITRDTSNRGYATGFAIEKAAGNARTLDFLSATLSETAAATGLRWQIGATADAESGSNAGSNWELSAYSDTGALLSQPIVVNRATGVLNFAEVPTVTGDGNVWTDTTGPVALANTTGFLTTGDVKLTIKITADAGWLMCNDQTIGPTGSAATYANNNCQALYEVLWNNVSNTYAPVAGGRGANAAADWAAAKPIQLLKMVGLSIGISGQASVGSDGVTWVLGQTFGEEQHTLTNSELPNHTHEVFLNDPEHEHTGQANVTSAGSFSGATALQLNAFGEQVNQSLNAQNFAALPASTGITINDGAGNNNQVGFTGGGVAHNNMQPTTRLNAMIKL